MIAFIFSLSVTAGEHAIDLERGRALFAQRCAVCHGEKGDGKSEAAASFHPSPANLNQASFAETRVMQVLAKGVAGTVMPSFSDLPAHDTASLVAYVLTLGPEKHADKASAEKIRRGANLFAIRCASCHGQDGAGDGPAAARVGRAPADFHSKQPTRQRIVDVLENGIFGTAMTPMKRLIGDDEVDALVAFIQSVFAG